MRQHSRVVHASSENDDIRASKAHERMASSISVDWGAKRGPQNPIVTTVHYSGLIVEKTSSTSNIKETIEGYF